MFYKKVHMMNLPLVCLGLYITIVGSTKPPGYVEPPKEHDPNPPKYEYGYSIGSQDSPAADGSSQGHKESRDGINTQGNYYVNFGSGQAHSDVQYIADDWGYHPIVRYSTHDGHSQVSGHFALGESAVDRLNKERGSAEKSQPLFSPVPPKQTAVEQPIETIHEDNHAPQTQHVQPEQHAQPPHQLPEFVQALNQQYQPPHLHYQPNPEQLQIIGIIPQGYPGNHVHHHRPSTLMYPVYQSTPDNHPSPQVLPPQEEHSLSDLNQPTHNSPQTTAENSKLVENTQNLITGKDVLDINHSVEDVSRNALFQAASELEKNHAASLAQQQAAVEEEDQKDIEQQLNTAQRHLNAFHHNPIVVDEQQPTTLIHSISTTEFTPLEVSIQPARERRPQSSHREKYSKQINVQIYDNNNGQYLKETTFDASKESSSSRHHSDTIRIPEAASRVFLKNFEKSHGPLVSENQAIYSTTSSTTSLNDYDYESQNSVTAVAPPQVVENVPDHLAPQVIPTHEQSDDSQQHQTLVQIEKSVSIKDVLFEQEHAPSSAPVFGERNAPKQSRKLHKPVYVDQSFANVVDRNIEATNQVDNQLHVSTAHGNEPDHSQIDYQSGEQQVTEQQSHEDHSGETSVEIQQQVIIPLASRPHSQSPSHSQSHHYVDRPYPAGQETAVSYPSPNVVEKYIDRPYPVEHTVNVPYPVETIVEQKVPVDRVVEKYIDRPVPYPVNVEKIVDRPYPVERIVEKYIDRPVEVEKVVEKQVNVPYPVHQVVERIVDRPVEKIVEKPVPYPYPVEVQKFVDRPYPVERIVEKEVRVPYAVEKIVDRPVEVEKIVEKTVEVPVDRIVEKFVDVKVEVPVEKIVDRPYPVEKIVEKYIDRPVPVAVHIPYAVHVPVHIPYAVEKHVHVPYPSHEQHHDHHQSFITSHPQSSKLVYTQHSNHIYKPEQHNHHKPAQHIKHIYIPNFPFASHYTDAPKPYHPHSPPPSTHLHPIKSSSHYSAPKPVYGLPLHFGGHQTKSTVPLFANHNYPHQTYAGNFGYSAHIYKDDYQGPPPVEHQQIWSYLHSPQPHHDPTSPSAGQPAHTIYESELVASGTIDHHQQLASPNSFTAHRNSLNFGKNLRWENGFKPPLIPSVQIDEHGAPINPEQT